MPARVLDVGSGSGILALAALRLGGEQAVALDTDPLAVESTLANAARNGLDGRVEASIGSLPDRPVERFALVLANLVAAVLVGLAPRLAAHLAPNGILLVSGVIEPRAGEVVAAMTAAGLRVVRRLDHGEWVSLRLEPAA